MIRDLPVVSTQEARSENQGLSSRKRGLLIRTSDACEFSLLNLPSVGMRDVLVVPAKGEKVQLMHLTLQAYAFHCRNISQIEDMIICFRMVIYVEGYCNTVMEVHDKKLFHAGYRNTFH